MKPPFSFMLPKRAVQALRVLAHMPELTSYVCDDLEMCIAAARLTIAMGAGQRIEIRDADGNIVSTVLR